MIVVDLMTPYIRPVVTAHRLKRLPRPKYSASDKRRSVSGWPRYCLLKPTRSLDDVAYWQILLQKLAATAWAGGPLVCESAWGSDADRQVKSLTSLIWVGSFRRADSH